MKANKKVLTCKIESVYATDAVPVVGTDDVEVWNFSVVPLEQRTTERNVVRPNMGAVEQLIVGEYMQMEFDVPMAGAGAVDTAPGYSSIMRMCRWAETITPTTGPVTYNPISDAEESASVCFYWDGVRHKMLGAGGSIRFDVNEENIPVMHVTALGLYGGIAVAALGGTPDLSAFQKPLALSEANTQFSIHGYAAPLLSFTIDQGAENVYKNRPNSEKVHYTDRRITGQITIECPKPDVKDFFAICRAGTTGAFSMTHGTTAGNKAILTASTVQLLKPRTSEGDNMVNLAMDMIFLPSGAGNDELSYATQ